MDLNWSLQLQKLCYLNMSGCDVVSKSQLELCRSEQARHFSWPTFLQGNLQWTQEFSMESPNYSDTKIKMEKVQDLDCWGFEIIQSHSSDRRLSHHCWQRPCRVSHSRIWILVEIICRQGVPVELFDDLHGYLKILEAQISFWHRLSLFWML